MKALLLPLATMNGFFGWLPQIVKLSQNRYRTQVRLFALAALVGIVAGVGAIGFYLTTRIAEHYALGVVAGYDAQPRPGGEAAFDWLPPSAAVLRPWLLVLIPTIGGLLSGWLVFTFAPEAEGHGTDSVIAAYHYRQGQIRPRVPLIKIVASALTIGSGGSGGREGPIAQIGAGFGSLLGNLLRLRPAERRVLMAAGMGAGIGAILAPLAGTIFAAEVLYSSTEFEAEVILPAGLASVVSYCVYGFFSGWEPLFKIPRPDLRQPAPPGSVSRAGDLHGRAGGALYALLLRLQTSVRPSADSKIFGRPSAPSSRESWAWRLYFALGRNEQVLAVLSFGYSAIQEAMTTDSGTAGV